METGNEGRNEKKFKNFGKRVDDFMVDLMKLVTSFKKNSKKNSKNLKQLLKK